MNKIFLQGFELLKKYWFLVLIFLLALFIRTIFVINNSISFHYDMARDAFAAQEIWENHDLKVQGPPTSISGLYHGVLYYYLIAPFYAIGKGNPQFPALALSFLNCLTVFPIYFLALKIFKERKLAVLSSLFFALSFEAIQYGSWLSNPGPALIFVCLYFLGLKLWEENSNWGLPIVVLSAAIATQFQFFFLYLFFLLPVFQYIFKTKATKSQLLIASISGLLGLSSILVSILKFGTLRKVIEGIFSISSSQQTVNNKLFSDLVENYLSHLANLFTNNFFPLNLFIGGILSILAFYLCTRNKFILFALFSSLPIFIFGGHSSNYANLGVLVPAILAMTLVVETIARKSLRFSIIFIVVVTLANLFSVLRILPKGQVSLVIPEGMVLSQQLSLIDKTYQIASGKPFAINTLTLPSWTNTTWAYFYSWYGRDKFGYVPGFYGRDQVGMPGEGALTQVSDPPEISFFIMEPISGIPPYIYSKEIEAEDSKTYLITVYKYGDITLQQRLKK